MKYKMGEIVCEFNCDYKEIDDQIKDLLKYHMVDSEHTDCQIELLMDTTLGRNEYDLSRNKDSYLCRYAHNFLEKTTQRFYYRVLFPTLEQISKDHNQLTVHCSVLGLEDGNCIIVLGPSGGGKTTCATAWLNYAMPIMGDDTIFVSNGKCYPMKRELHICEEKISEFTQLRDVNGLEPYMPGYKKLGYDWIIRYPELIMEVSDFPKLLVATSVSQEKRTTYKIITDNEMRHNLLRENIGVYNDVTIKNFFKKIDDVPFLQIAWGTDVWSFPQMHFGYLQGLYIKITHGK